MTLRALQDGAVIKLIGELDLETAHVLEDTFVNGPPGAEVSLDLSELTFMDSSGLRVLLGLRNLYGQVVLINPSPPVERLLELTLAERADGFAVRRDTAGPDSSTT
jgi:anti-anti-sigma factor